MLLLTIRKARELVVAVLQPSHRRHHAQLVIHRRTRQEIAVVNVLLRGVVARVLLLELLVGIRAIAFCLFVVYCYYLNKKLELN